MSDARRNGEAAAVTNLATSVYSRQPKLYSFIILLRLKLEWKPSL